MKKHGFIFTLLCLLLIATLSTPAAAYTAYSETFILDAIDGTTRWAAPLKNGTSYLYSTITSKWNEQRSSGTSPHVGIDVGIGTSNKAVAAAGALYKDTSSGGTAHNNIALNVNHAMKSVYCHGTVIPPRK